MKIEHIVVTTDLSPDALRPCAAVAELARTLGSRITLLHVVEDLEAVPHGAPLAPAQSAPDLPRRVEAARPRLEEQAAAFGSDLAPSLEVIGGADIAATVADYAQEQGADLIALSTHGRTGFRHLVLGSVAEALLRHSPVPVLVFPRPRE